MERETSRCLTGTLNVHFSLIIRRYLDPEGNLSLQDAVGLIYLMLPEKVDESTGSNMDCGLFENDILQLAAETPYNDKTQFRLAKLVSYLINSHKLSDWESGQKARNPRSS
jgi:hypothetical protein